MGIMPTKAELALEQSQQGVSYEVSVSIEGVDERKRIVRIKGEKKEDLYTTLGRNWISTCLYRLSHSEIVDIEKVAVRSSLWLPNNKCALIDSQAVIKSPTHYPCDNCQNIRVILFSTHSDDGSPSRVNIKQLCDAPVTRTASAAVKSCQGDSFEFYLITYSTYTD
ncbi:hypothetical protein Tco_1530161 [Tanacetum coccineum]